MSLSWSMPSTYHSGFSKRLHYQTCYADERQGSVHTNARRDRWYWEVKLVPNGYVAGGIEDSEEKAKSKVIEHLSPNSIRFVTSLAETEG